MRIRLNILVLICLIPFLALSNNGKTRITPSQYIEKYKEDAVKGMRKYKIPASITLAQGMLESGNGNSTLAVKANNHFGIKCHSNWNGKTIRKDDDKKNECFRKYSSVIDSYEDHAKFLTGKSRYASLFELKITDYKGWAKGLKKAGYATNPKYPSLLINIIEKHQLYQYDSNKKIKKEKKTKQDAPKKVKPITPQPVVTKSRTILQLGIKKYVVIKKGDTFYSIAKETDKELWQLYKYNDLTADDKLTIGNKLFLQPKNKKAKVPFHTVKEGETLKHISQLYGVKLKSLYKKNYIKEGEKPKAGQKIYMRKSKPTDSF